MQVRVAGAVEVVGDAGESIPLGAPRERAVLSWLAVHAPSVVSADNLIEALWGDDPPASATKTAQTLVYRLRRSLGEGMVETVGKGYRLNVDASVVDLRCIERLVADARRSTAAGDFVAAARHLREARELWRGEPLTELAGTPLADAEVRRLRELHHNLIDDLHDALLATGAASELVADLEAGVVAEPLRERRWAQLMLALYRSGRQADALNAFQRARAVLVEDLGIEPGPELRDLERRILDQDTGLAVHPSPKTGRSAESTPGSSGVSDLTWVPPSALAMVGRVEETRMLLAAWDAVVTGGGRHLVLIAGEPGIGKSRLAAEFALQIDDLGGVVWHGRCDPELGAPYQPFTEAINRYATVITVERLRKMVGRAAAQLARVAPVLSAGIDAGVSSAVDVDSEQLQVMGAVSHLLGKVARERPVLFVLDDLHWAEAPTMRMLHYLLREGSSTPVLFVATYRSEDVNESQRCALAEMHRTERVSRLDLTGLHEDAVTDLIHSVTGHELHGDIGAAAQRLVDLTGGNPYFVGETLRFLRDSGAVVRGDDDRWQLAEGFNTGDLPAGVREIIGMRLARLDATHVDALRAAAVQGPVFDANVLGGVLGGDAADALDAASAAGLVHETPAFAVYEFAHDLLRQHLLSGLSTLRRTRLHWRIAERLAAGRRPDVEDVAHHGWEGALAGDPEVAAGWMRAASADALARSAPDSALTQIERAFAVLDGLTCPPNLLSDLLTDRVIALLDTDCEVDDDRFLSACVAADEAALATQDPARIVRAHTLGNRMSPASRLGVCDERSAAAVAHAIETLPKNADDERAVLTGYLAEVLAYASDTERRTRVMDMALALMTEDTPPAVRRQVIIHLAQASFQDAERPAQARRLAQELAASGDQMASMLAIGHFGTIDLIEGDFDAAGRSAALLREGGQRANSRVAVLLGAILAVGVASAHGDLETVRDIRATTLPFDPTPRTRRMYESFAFLSSVAITLWTGTDEDASARLLAYAKTAPQASDLLMTAAAWVMATAGEDGPAEVLWSELRQRPASLPARNIARTTIPMCRYELIRRWGTAEEARESRTLLEPLSGLWGGNAGVCLGPVDYWLACYSDFLGEHVQARRQFDQARQQAADRGLDRWVERIDATANET